MEDKKIAELESVPVEVKVEKNETTNKQKVVSSKTKPIVKKERKNVIPTDLNIPEEVLNVAAIVKFNTAFKRWTAINILNTLKEDGIIDSVKGSFVEFLWNKFCVTSQGLKKEYRYTEDLFIDALVKSHADVASDNQRTINNLLDSLNKDK